MNKLLHKIDPEKEIRRIRYQYIFYKIVQPLNRNKRSIYNKIYTSILYTSQFILDFLPVESLIFSIDTFHLKRFADIQVSM